MKKVQSFADFEELYKKNDTAIESWGGNPYSPIWICGMEFGGGNTRLHEFIRYAGKSRDLAGITRIRDSEAEYYDYANIAAALVACLTDQGLLSEYESCSDNLEALRNLGIEWSRTRKYFSACGYGFRMNAFPLSLPTNDNWEKTRVYLEKGGNPISVKDFFLTGSSDNLNINDYRQRVRDYFRVHVQNRLERYRPKLVICTGLNYKWHFKSLFLDEDSEEGWNGKTGNRKDWKAMVSKATGDYSLELYCHRKTDTHIVICNFLGTRNNYVGQRDVVSFVRDIRGLPEMDFLSTLKAPSPIRADGRIVEILDDAYSRILNQTEFFESDAVTKFLKERNDAKPLFSKMLKNIRPQDADIFSSHEPTNAEAFWVILDDALQSLPRKAETVRQLFKLMECESRRQIMNDFDDAFKFPRN